MTTNTNTEKSTVGDDEDDQLCDDEGEDGFLGVFDGDADDRPSEYFQGPYKGGEDFIQDPPPVEQNTDEMMAVLNWWMIFCSEVCCSPLNLSQALFPTSRWWSFGRSSIKLRCQQSRQCGKCLLLFKFHPHR